MEPQDQHKSYRPSKHFLIRGGIAFGIVILVLIVQTSWFRALLNKEPKTPIINANETIGGLIGKDTNGNGVPDWEERLWGLDPTVLFTNGIPNKQIIEQKKEALGITEDQNGPLNETDILAQQLFSITSAIEQSDQSDTGALSNIGTDLGNSIKFKQITNHYSLQNIKTTKTTTTSIKKYYSEVTKLVSQYKEETATTDILVPALETGDFSGLPKLKQTADSYIKFSKSLQSITVQVGIAGQHLALLNGFYGMEIERAHV